MENVLLLVILALMIWIFELKQELAEKNLKYILLKVKSEELRHDVKRLTKMKKGD